MAPGRKAIIRASERTNEVGGGAIVVDVVEEADCIDSLVSMDGCICLESDTDEVVGDATVDLFSPTTVRSFSSSFAIPSFSFSLSFMQVSLSTMMMMMMMMAVVVL